MASPIYKTKNGQFSVAIFENEKGNSVSLQKSYTDKEGQWKNQGLTVFPKDIDRVIGLLEEASKQQTSCCSWEATPTPPNKATELLKEKAALCDSQKF